jgi:hypothetical protein
VDQLPSAEALITLAFAWGLPALLGAGVMALLQAGARAKLEAAMAEKFVRIEKHEQLADDVDKLGAKVDGVISAVGSANAMADDALELGEKLERRMQTMEQLVMPQLEKISETLVEQGKHLARQTGVLETFMDEYRGRHK